MQRGENSIRFGLFPSFFYTQDRQTGALEGFGIELAHSFARALGRELRLTEYAAPPQVVQALKSGDCDIAAMGLAPGRGRDVEFSPPWLRADFTFLAPPGSGIETIADIDRPDLRVAVVRNHAMDFALEGKLFRAERVYATTPDEAFGMVRGGEADILAGIRPGLLRHAGMMPGSTVLKDRYGENILAFAVAKGRYELLSAATRFVTNARETGLLQRIIEETGLGGAEPVLVS